MINRVIKIGLSASLLATSLYSASFDCKKASTFIEKTICNDTELSKLDEELASAYKKVFNSLSDKTELKKDQLDWLKNSRDKCTSLEALKTTYTNRVLYLTNYDNRNSQTNTVAISSNDVAGLYKKDSTSSEVNQDLSFSAKEPVKAQKVENYKFVGSDDLEAFPSDYVDKMLSLNCKRTNVEEDVRSGGYDINPVCKDSKGKYGFMGFNPFQIKVKTYDKNIAREIAKSEAQEKYFLGVLKVDNSQFAVTKHIFEIREVKYK